MKLYVEETIGNVVEVESLITILEIADFDAGLRQMLEAEQSDTISAGSDITLTDNNKVIQFINPNGADRNVYLPTASINNHGFVIINTAASSYTLTVLSGTTTLGVIQADSGIGWFISNGIVWKGEGGGSSTVEVVIEEEDGAPSAVVETIKVPNGSLVDYGEGVVTLFENGIIPRSAMLFPDQCTPSGAMTFTVNASQRYCQFVTITTPALNNTYDYTVVLEKGTYEIKIYYYGGSTGGTGTLYIDGNSVDVFSYRGAAANLTNTLTGKVLSFSGLHTVQMKMTAVGTGGSGYSFQHTFISFRRTGD